MKYQEWNGHKMPLEERVKSMSMPEIINWLVDEVIENRKGDNCAYRHLTEEIEKLHCEIHAFSNVKKLNMLERKITELWNLLPKTNDLLTKNFLNEVLKNYYTRAESDIKYTTDSITRNEIMEVAIKVFGD